MEAHENHITNVEQEGCAVTLTYVSGETSTVNFSTEESAADYVASHETKPKKKGKAEPKDGE